MSLIYPNWFCRRNCSEHEVLAIWKLFFTENYYLDRHSGHCYLSLSIHNNQRKNKESTQLVIWRVSLIEGRWRIANSILGMRPMYNFEQNYQPCSQATFSLSQDVIFLMTSPLFGRFLVSVNLQSEICGLQSAVCSLQMSYTAFF